MSTAGGVLRDLLNDWANRSFLEADRIELQIILDSLERRANAAAIAGYALVNDNDVDSANLAIAEFREATDDYRLATQKYGLEVCRLL